MPTWEELEARFVELQPALRFSRLDVQWGGTAGERWRLAGAQDANARRKFEALARLAGDKLGETLVYEQVDCEEIITEPKPEWRWYKGIWKISGNFEYAFYGRELDDNEELVGIVHAGSIMSPVEASSAFCLELASSYPERNNLVGVETDQPSQKFWERYGRPMLIGIFVTVFAGLILALMGLT